MGFKKEKDPGIKCNQELKVIENLGPVPSLV